METFTYSDDGFSDLHKDVYGFRPRGIILSNWNILPPAEKKVRWDQLCEELEANTKFKNEQEVNKMFLKAFEKGYNDLEDKNIVKLFPGMYTKVTAHCLGHDSSEAATEKIYNAITEINKSKSNDLKKNPA